MKLSKAKSKMQCKSIFKTNFHLLIGSCIAIQIVSLFSTDFLF